MPARFLIPRKIPLAQAAGRFGPGDAQTKKAGPKAGPDGAIVNRQSGQGVMPASGCRAVSAWVIQKGGDRIQKPNRKNACRRCRKAYFSCSPSFLRRSSWASDHTVELFTLTDESMETIIRIVRTHSCSSLSNDS